VTRRSIASRYSDFAPPASRKSKDKGRFCVQILRLWSASSVRFFCRLRWQWWQFVWHPPITPVNIQGQYEVIASSTANPSGVSLIETNFSQAGTSASASTQNVVIIQGTQSSNGITLVSLGGECDNGTLGDDSIQGTFSSQTQASISLNEAGSLGSVAATGNVTFASDGSAITTGTYSIPAACGFLANSGSITGTKISPFSGSYAGMLDNGAGSTDAVIVSVTQSGLNLTVTGTDNGMAFTLTGSVVGATFDVTGTIAGRP